MNIPLVNLARQYESIQKTVDAAIQKICKTSDFILGEEVREFEAAFASYVGVKFCVGVASGTDAIKLMALAIDIKPGDEIIMQANTFIATALPFIELGATPVFVDCDSETGQISVDEIVAAITPKTKVIIPVHLYGHPAPMALLKKATKNWPHITILEDACQAHGSTINGKKCGSFGEMAAFSFYPGKNLGAYGDGGAVVTNNAKLAQKLRILRNIGQKSKYDHTILGTNSRLDTVQAAVLKVKLPHIDDWNIKRNSIALRYISNLSHVSDLSLPLQRTNTNWHLFVIQTKKRDALMKYLEKKGIHTGIHYPVPLHLTPALKFLGYKKGDFPNSEFRATTTLTLPLYAELTTDEVSYICASIQEFYET